MSPAAASRRQQRRAQRIREMLDAALDLLAEGGLDAVGVNALARRLGYTPAALYRYFDSRDALIAALQEQVLTELAGTLEASRQALGARLASGEAPYGALEPGDVEAVETLARIAAIPHLYAAYAADQPGRFGLISVTLADPRELVNMEDAGPVASATFRLSEAVAGPIRAAQDAGHLTPGDPLRRAILLWSSTQGVLQLGKLGRFAPETLERGRLVAELTRDLLAGWGADTEAVDAALAVVAP